MSIKIDICKMTIYPDLASNSWKLNLWINRNPHHIASFKSKVNAIKTRNAIKLVIKMLDV